MCHLLHSDKFGINAVFSFGEELIMGSELSDTSLLKYSHKVSLANGREAMGNHKGRSSDHEPIKGFLHKLL